MSEDAFPEDEKELLELGRNFICNAVPHNRELGMRMVALGRGEATVALPWDERLVGNPETRVLHGGAVTTLLDVTCGAAVYMKLRRTVRIATLDLRIDYLRPAAPERELVAHAVCYRLTRSVAFVRAVAHQGNEEDAVATAQGTFAIVAGESMP